MSLFKKIFGGRPKDIKCSVAEWAIQAPNDVSGHDITFQNLVLSSIMLFDGADPSLKEHYLTDITLFEAGIYLYFRGDMWQFTHAPHRRTDTSCALIRSYKMLYGKAFSADIQNVFENRVEYYGEMAQNRATHQKYHEFLVDIIGLSNTEKIPKAYNLRLRPLPLLNGDEMFRLRMQVIQWEAGGVREYIKSLAYA